MMCSRELSHKRPNKEETNRNHNLAKNLSNKTRNYPFKNHRLISVSLVTVLIPLSKRKTVKEIFMVLLKLKCKRRNQ